MVLWGVVCISSMHFILSNCFSKLVDIEVAEYCFFFNPQHLEGPFSEKAPKIKEPFV